MEVLIKVGDLSKSIGGKLLFENTSFDIASDNCIGLLGPNGCGKSTLFKVLLGWIHADSGDIWKKDNLQIRYLDQVPIGVHDETVYDYFIRNTQSDSIQQRILDYESQLEDPEIYKSTRYEEILEEIRKLRISASKNASKQRWDETCSIIKELGMSELSVSTKPNLLSGGERQKIALAVIFAQSKDCDLLLLDEPTNHLDIETIEWLEHRIVDFDKAVMIVSHDRYLLDDLVDRVYDFEGYNIVKYDATYEEYEEQKQIRTHIKTKAYEKSKAEMKRQKKVIETLSRRNKYDRQIASKIKRLAKMQQVENPVLKSYLLKFSFKSVFKSGKNVAEGHGLVKRFGSKGILEDAAFEIFAGQKIGLIGPNGCGKTTFLKMLTGKLPPDEGKLYVSTGIRSGYFDQGHLSLNPDNNLIDELKRDNNQLSESDAKALLGQFNFETDMFLNKVQSLSGGERARLAILRLLLQPYNLLLLDEPTNHMDMDSKKAIESAINSYTGTVIAVSHDRRFLDNIADVIFFMDDASIKMYTGNYTSFRLQRQKELTDLSDKNLAYLSSSGLKRYVVRKAFTIWTTRTKHKAGEEVFIGEHNEKIYEWAIKSKILELADNPKKRK